MTTADKSGGSQKPPVANETETPEKPEEPRKTPVLDPSCIRINSRDHCWSTYLVTLTPDIRLDDLQMPSLWSSIQSRQSGNGIALRVLDELTIVDADVSWLIVARVAAATANGASITVISKKDMPARTESLPQSETHKLLYNGVGYQIVSKRTGAAVGGMTYHSFAQAQAALWAQSTRAA